MVLFSASFLYYILKTSELVFKITFTLKVVIITENNWVKPCSITDIEIHHSIK